MLGQDTAIDRDAAVPPDSADLAPWRVRAGAFAVDVVVGLAVVATLVLVAWSTPQGTWLWWGSVVSAAMVLLAVAANRLLLPAVTGWSLGRGSFGIAVVGRDGAAVGPWRLLARDAAHLLDTVPLLLGWLWPVWDPRRRTFADMLVGTEVRRRQHGPSRAKSFAVGGVSAATAVAVGYSALGYFGVYRDDLRRSQAREQLAVQGPALVTEMLSYQAQTLQADFGRAKTVVTDGYRPQLEEQQNAIQKAGPVDNDYWSPNAAVLTSSEDRGTMIVLLQGQRGTPPNYRTISATVKADFERAGDGRWKVANLTVLARPQPVGAGG